uniref:Uncharacterized protein n=1 Tax=Rhizophagus irregularis (strain DAOM 181602 / DAOM 197198 / MUCL 43194) TaxID=747089 RepID=U9T4D3_RHIID
MNVSVFTRIHRDLSYNENKTSFNYIKPIQNLHKGLNLSGQKLSQYTSDGRLLP